MANGIGVNGRADSRSGELCTLLDVLDSIKLVKLTLIILENNSRIHIREKYIQSIITRCCGLVFVGFCMSAYRSIGK